MTMTSRSYRHHNEPYAGYFKTEIPTEDAEITRVLPGTPMGEYMRRFWQPVCMSEQLTDLPHAIRILGEDLVAFRDRRGKVGLLHRHCCHRGTSLEYGIIQERGIRCCYHGFHFDIDGRILDVPGETDHGEKLRDTVSQGAYPVLERDGLVFAYFGPPNEKPKFPEYDGFEKTNDTKLIPFSNVYPCNWLQIMDNIADQIHTYILHNTAALYDGPMPSELDASKFTLSNAFVTLPVLDYQEVRDRTGMVFIAGRRVSDDKVWIRINDLIVPNITQHAYLYEDGSKRRLWHRVHMSRWYVPIDDTNAIIFGWRMFGKNIDPLQLGDESKVGWDKMDFLDGQVGDRSYQEAQRIPGDWEAVSSQRPIAIHALENPMSIDSGIYMNRKLIRDAVRGETPMAAPQCMHERANAGLPTHCYTNNTIMEIPQKADEEEDRAMIFNLGKSIVAIAAQGDQYTGRERDAFIIKKIEELEASFQ